MHNKIVYSIAGATGAALLSWRTLFPWIGEDVTVLKASLAVAKVMKAALENGRPFIDTFEEQVVKHGKKPLIIFDDNIYTYEFINEQANRVANIVKTWGVSCGDTVAILITNEPAFVWTTLGLQKLGIVSANINYHLKLDQLVHSVVNSEAKALIVGAGEHLFHSLSEVRDKLCDIPVYVQGVQSGDLPPEYISFDDLMSRSLPVPVDKNVRSSVTPFSTACLIFTSGTTGFPKPAVVTHLKIFGLSAMIKLVHAGPDDVVYVPLPLYHSAAGGIGLYGTIGSGCTMVLRRKFSATKFWDDCRKYNVTIIQYIGELCRYLLGQPKHHLDGVHSIRAAIGNGLRSDIWKKFQHRFRIPLICEFYGATEGTGMTFNISNTPGAIGRLSPVLKFIRPPDFYQTLVKYDYATAEPLRDKQGRCIEIRAGEKGLFISSIPQMQTDAGVKFYKASDAVNKKKIIHNAFTNGDLFFNSGDLFYLDKNYFVYFADRIGDTFRWKGENVSTTEVANILTQASFVQDANVYGVHIPGHDGQAGMAAITLRGSEPISADSLKTLAKICQDNLPSYARPLFLRIQKEASITATFKQQKFNLVEEGFDPAKVRDPLYYLNHENHQYIPVTSELYAQLLTKSKL
ncbi:long-chain fatty acid transport protein 6-like [Gigantopelta aegis]|uniref:long-chain fatty acid transport protein 6-like n=1 Tax=Gigantopelta aegis TaxID=1735272 RepID=UPI001B889194|nr:long-chain fatty acid transport protein 6-like [Gigantopelta aegis]XP_041361862.1 long-chain fatty acid transport protein 6-like [Gigantopelta aegis]